MVLQCEILNGEFLGVYERSLATVWTLACRRTSLTVVKRLYVLSFYPGIVEHFWKGECSGEWSYVPPNSSLPLSRNLTARTCRSTSQSHSKS